MFGHFIGIFRDDDFVSAEAERVGGLAGRGGEEDDVGAERTREFDSHVAEAAESDNADFLAGPDFPVTQRRVGGDAGAEQRCGGGEVHFGGDLQSKGLVDNDALGVAAEGGAAEVLVRSVVGKDRGLLAVLLQAALTTGTDAAGIHKTANGSEVAFLEFLHVAAGFHDATDDFVAGHDGIDGVVPFIASLMKI